MSKQRERFEKVASKRVQNIIDSLNSLSKCSNTYNYEYSSEDVDKIFKALNLRLNNVKTQFVSKLDKKDFSL